MKILTALLVSSLPLRLLAQTTVPEEQIPTLLKQAKVFTDAYERADAESYLRMTHSSIEKYKIPRDQLILIIREAMLRPRALGIVLEKTELARPSACYIASVEIVCFLPRRMTVRMNEKREVMKGYLVAARAVENNRDWRFLDSDAFHKQRSRLWEVFPALPTNIKTPPIAIESAP